MLPRLDLLTMPITIALPLDVPEVSVLASRMLEDGTLLIEVESTFPDGPVSPLWLRDRLVFTASTDRSGCGTCRCLVGLSSPRSAPALPLSTL